MSYSLKKLHFRLSQIALVLSAAFSVLHPPFCFLKRPATVLSLFSRVSVCLLRSSFEYLCRICIHKPFSDPRCVRVEYGVRADCTFEVRAIELCTRR